MSPVTLAFVVVLTSAQFSTAPPPSPDQAPVVRDLEIDLGADFVTKAKLTLPSMEGGRRPTVILFHGSGPSDMDATVSGIPGKPPISTNFKEIAETLREAGIASVRFNKRGVHSATEIDWDQASRATLLQLIDDADAVIEATLAQPEVDSDKLFLYGWSQGAQVAVHVALRRPELAGLILQGAPTSGWEGVFRHEHLKLGIPYLKEHADKDGDGRLSMDELYALPYQPITPVGLMPSLYIWADDSAYDYPRIRPEVDRNNDGMVDIERELRRAVEEQIESPRPNRMIPRDSEPEQRIADVLPALDMPILLLHGENDGWVPVEDAYTIAATAPDRVTLQTFPNLGHALAQTQEPAIDAFGRAHGLAARCAANWIGLILGRDAERPIKQPRLSPLKSTR